MNGKLLRSYRTNRRVRQADLAAAMGTSRQNIASMEKVDDVKLPWALRYFRALFGLTNPGSDVALQVDLIVDGEVQGSEIVE